MIPEARLLAELRAISARYPDMRMTPLAAGPVSFDGRLEIEGVEHRVRLTLPPSYPRVPPELRELDLRTGAELPPLGRPNRLEGVGLCLFPHGNDEQAWRQDRLAVEAIERFKIFIRTEQQRQGVVPAAARLHVPPRIVNRMVAEGPGVLLARSAPEGREFYVTEASLPSGVRIFSDLAEGWAELLPKVVHIPWLVVSDERPWSELAGDATRLDATLRAELREDLYRAYSSSGFLVLVRKTTPQAEVDILCLCRPPPGQAHELLELRVVRDSPSDCLFHRVDGVLTCRDQLQPETVIVVGLGSIGGAVALALARAGLRRFVLIDPDTLTIENVCRHVGSLRDLGCHKVSIIHDAILSVNPAAEVDTITKSLTWDLPWLSAGAELHAQLSTNKRCIVVSTCAEHRAERSLNELAIETATPVVYAAALGAAEHARIFRVLPGRTPCLECILSAQNDDPSAYPRFISPAAGGEDQANYLAPGLPGLGIDVTQIAMIAARFTLQTIAELRGLELGLAPEGGDHLLWTNRGGWLFDRPLQLTVEHFPKSSACLVCGPARPDVFGADEQAELAELVTKLQRP